MLVLFTKTFYVLWTCYEINTILLNDNETDGCLMIMDGKFSAVLHKIIYEPPHDKTNKMACVPSKDSDQPGHLPNLISVFAVRMKKPCVLSYPLSTQRRLIRLG